MDKSINNSWQLGIDKNLTSCCSSLKDAVQRLANVIDEMNNFINGVSIKEQVFNFGDNHLTNLTGEALWHDLSGWDGVGKRQGSQKGNNEDLSLHFQESKEKSKLNFVDIYLLEDRPV